MQGPEAVNCTQNLYGDQWGHGNHGYDTECIPYNIAANCLACAHGKGQEKGRGHGAGRYTTGIEGNGGKYFWDKKGED